MKLFTKSPIIEVAPELSALQHYEQARVELGVIQTELKAAEKAFFDHLRTHHAGKLPGVSFINGKLFVEIGLLNKYPALQGLQAAWMKISQQRQAKLAEMAQLKKSAGFASY